MASSKGDYSKKVEYIISNDMVNKARLQKASDFNMNWPSSSVE